MAAPAYDARGVHALPSLPLPLPTLPSVGTTVRVTTGLAGLTLEGMLLAVNVFDGTLTIQTHRFKHPLRIQVENVKFLQQVESAPAPAAVGSAPAVHLAPEEHRLAAQARDAAQGLARLVSAAKAVALSPVLTAAPSPPAPPSPALSASSGLSENSVVAGLGSMLSGSSKAFVPATAAQPVATYASAPMMSVPAPVHRTTSAPAVPVPAPATFGQRTYAHQQHGLLPPPAMAPPGMGGASLPRSMSYGVGSSRGHHMRGPVPAMTTAMAVPAVSAPLSASPPRVQQPRPQRSVSPPGLAPARESNLKQEVCKYFNTAKGCSRGPACRYRHTALPGMPLVMPTQAAPAAPARRSRRRHARRVHN